MKIKEQKNQALNELIYNAFLLEQCAKDIRNNAIILRQQQESALSKINNLDDAIEECNEWLSTIRSLFKELYVE